MLSGIMLSGIMLSGITLLADRRIAEPVDQERDEQREGRPEGGAVRQVAAELVVHLAECREPVRPRLVAERRVAALGQLGGEGLRARRRRRPGLEIKSHEVKSHDRCVDGALRDRPGAPPPGRSMIPINHTD